LILVKVKCMISLDLMKIRDQKENNSLFSYFMEIKKSNIKVILIYNTIFRMS